MVYLNAQDRCGAKETTSHFTQNSLSHDCIQIYMHANALAHVQYGYNSISAQLLMWLQYTCALVSHVFDRAH